MSSVRESGANMQIFEKLYNYATPPILYFEPSAFQLFIPQVFEVSLFQFAHELLISELARFVAWNVCESDCPFTRRYLAIYYILVSHFDHIDLFIGRELDWKHSHKFFHMSFQYPSHLSCLIHTSPSRDRPSQLHLRDATIQPCP